MDAAANGNPLADLDAAATADQHPPAIANDRYCEFANVQRANGRPTDSHIAPIRTQQPEFAA